MRAPFSMIDSHASLPASESLLVEIHAQRGMTTNLERAMATAPALLAAYTRVMELFEASSFTPLERQVILYTTSIDNHCRYCVAWHTAMLLKAGLSQTDVTALYKGHALSNLKLDALRRFSAAISQVRGHVSDSALQDFLEVGWTKRQALEMIVGIAAKTLSNYASSLTQVPLDRAVEKYAQ
jgi:AhpD family alkylhydroperoxidase